MVLLHCFGVGVVCVWGLCGVLVLGMLLVVVMLPLRLGLLWVVCLQVVRGVAMPLFAVDVVVVLVNGLVRAVLVSLLWMWEGCVCVGGVWVV